MRSMSHPVLYMSVKLLAVVAALLVFANSGRAQLNLQPFVNPHPVVTAGTIGFAFAGDMFVGSVQSDGTGVLYQTDLLGKNVALFAPDVSIPPGSYSSEHPVAGSPGLGGFPLWDVYVGAGDSVIHISHDGTESDVFATNLPGPVAAIRFDSFGTFGFEMLVATWYGAVCHINSVGVSACPVNSLGLVEGMDIAPPGAGFGPFDGQLITVSETSGLVQAISPSWQVTVLNGENPIPDAESLNFVPLNVGSSGSAVEGFYEANYTSNSDIVKAAAGQFSSFKGDAVIATEMPPAPIWRMHWVGTRFVISQIGASPAQAEGATFVTPGMLARTACPVTGGRERHWPIESQPPWCAPYCIKVSPPKK